MSGGLTLILTFSPRRRRDLSPSPPTIAARTPNPSALILILAMVRAAGGLTLILTFSPQRARGPEPPPIHPPLLPRTPNPSALILILAMVRAAGGLTLILTFSPQGRRDLPGGRVASSFPRRREPRIQCSEVPCSPVLARSAPPNRGLQGYEVPACAGTTKRRAVTLILRLLPSREKGPEPLPFPSGGLEIPRPLGEG